MIYLDFNRTTPIAPSVLEAMQPYWSAHFMLPGQEHPQAQAVGEAVEQAREQVAMMAGCDAFEIVFTSGGTEANNLAVLGITSAMPPGHVLVSAVEHDSVLLSASALTARGWDVQTIPCGRDGEIDPDVVAAMIRGDTRLVCVQLANAFLGTLQPIRAIADRCHPRGVPLHCDATQAFGKIAVNVSELRADTVSICSHRIYGPKGSGAIYVRRGLTVSPIMFGEPREMGLRPGSENIPAIIGLGAAANLAARCVDDASENLRMLRDRLVAGLQVAMGSDLVVLAEDSDRLPNTIALEFPINAKQIQQSARQLVLTTAQSGQPPDEMTRTLRVIGCSDSQVARTIRFSLGWTTSRDQIDRAIATVAEACQA